MDHQAMTVPPFHTAYDVGIGALSIGLGVALPPLFHAVGLGPAFLPMFLPLLIGAFFLRPWLACCVGGMTPWVSTLLTGMPPLAPPITPVMAAEAAALCGMAALGYHRWQWGLWTTLVVAIAAERVVLAAGVFGLAPLLGASGAWLTAGMLLLGLPGIAVQLMVVPPVVRRLERSLAGGGRRG